MVKHIIFWKLTDEALKDAQKHAKKLQAMFDNLEGKVEGFIKGEIGLNYNGGNYDMVLYSEFESKEAEAFYQTHPLHLEIKSVVKELVCGRECIDYVI